MKPVFNLLGKYKKEAVLAPLFKLLEALFELFVPLVVANLIDCGIAQNDKPYIVKMFFLMVLLAVVGLVCSITAQYFAAKAAVGVGTKLRSNLFKHIQSLSFTELDKLGTSTMITRMTSDVNQVQNGVNMLLRLVLRSPFIVFGAMIMAFTIDFNSAMVFVGAIPVLMVVVF
ncbi:MAG: ABC transporter permease, partial [Acutalibacteraceae bacterium]|nr:ABC transporter permease [Acutalibacteraceae bacterium]